ncbi:hypothetical protein D3C81_1201480 [compost metagenome]
MLERGWGKIGLWAAAADQHGTLPFQPLLFGQAGGDGVDFGGFADDQQETGFAAPEWAVVGAHEVAQIQRLEVRLTRKIHGCICLRKDLSQPPLLAMALAFQMRQQTGCQPSQQSDSDNQ